MSLGFLQVQVQREAQPMMHHTGGSCSIALGFRAQMVDEQFSVTGEAKARTNNLRRTVVALTIRRQTPREELVNRGSPAI